MTAWCTIDRNDFRLARRGRGQVIVVENKKRKTDDVCNYILDGIARDVLYPRVDRQAFMRDNDEKTCTVFYVDVTVRRGRTYKKRKE